LSCELSDLLGVFSHETVTIQILEALWLVLGLVLSRIEFVVLGLVSGGGVVSEQLAPNFLTVNMMNLDFKNLFA
jgi:hypothetical protein